MGDESIYLRECKKTRWDGMGRGISDIDLTRNPIDVWTAWDEMTWTG